jgi:hypothetical protein
MVRGIRSVSWDKEDGGAASLQNTRYLTGVLFVFCVLLHLPPIRFLCVGGRWDRTLGCCDFGIGSQTL